MVISFIGFGIISGAGAVVAKLATGGTVIQALGAYALYGTIGGLAGVAALLAIGWLRARHADMEPAATRTV